MAVDQPPQRSGLHPLSLGSGDPAHPSDPASRRVVALGASVGGLQAISAILAKLPATFPAPIVIVQHLSPHTPSQMAGILSRRTRLRVKEAKEGDLLQAGTVYVAPPARHLMVRPGERLTLSDSEKVHHSRPAVDVLFSSLASSVRSRGIGVVLTGGDGDGSSGIRAIKAAGGVTIAQDVPSSQQPSMPLSAVATGSVDFVLPLSEIAAALAALVADSSAVSPEPEAAVSPIVSASPIVSVSPKIAALPRTSVRRLKKVFNPDMTAKNTALVRVQAAWQCAGQFSGNGTGPGEPGKLVTTALKEIDTCMEALVEAEAALVDQNHALEEFQSLLREERRYYKALLNIVSESIIATDSAGIVRAVNPAAARLLGRSAAYMVGRPFAHTAPQRARPAFEGAVRQALAAGGSQKGLCLTARAGLPSVIATASAMKDEQGATLGLLWRLHPNDPGPDGELDRKKAVLEETRPEAALPEEELL